MKWLLLAGMLAVTPAHADQLPAEMMGYWQPNYPIPEDWPGSMHRIPRDAYEWAVSQTQWLMWDGLCKINHVTELGDMDFDVEATCGLAEGYGPPYHMQEPTPDQPLTEEHYQFALCGETLSVNKIKDQPNPHKECKADKVPTS